MTGKAIQDLVGRVMIDRDFLADLVRDPDAVLAGYELTAEERSVILLAARPRGPRLGAGARARSESRHAEAMGHLGRPSAARAAARAARGADLMASPEIEFLREVSLFQDVEESVLRALWPSFRERRLRQGDVLFRDGGAGRGAVPPQGGQHRRLEAVTGRVEQVLGRIEPGEAFGEMSVFGDERHRSATCQAEADSLLYSLDRDSLRRFIAGSPRTAARFFQHMAQVAFQRLRDSSDLVAEVTRWGLEATGLDVEHK